MRKTEEMMERRGRFRIMAAAVLAVVPMIVIYVIFQKQFVEGIATSGGKL